MKRTSQSSRSKRPSAILPFFSLVLMVALVLGVLQVDAKRSSAPEPVVSARAERDKYREVKYPTPNIAHGQVNDVQGVILHHTAEPTVERSLYVLTKGKRKVGTHVVIDTDGTRYVMAAPHQVTFHAGPSVLAGRDGCNYFTVGIEFQGNTLEAPLTQHQIDSAIEYLQPIISRYKIPLANIVTHEMVRNAYKKKYPRRRCSGKVDITQAEYTRFMQQLRAKL